MTSLWEFQASIYEHCFTYKQFHAASETNSAHNLTIIAKYTETTDVMCNRYYRRLLKK
jgi:hypothetical protein